MLFLEKIAPSRVAHARVCCEDSAQRKTSKMASEITFVGDEEIQFLSSVSLPNLRQALGKNFLEGDFEYEDYTSDSNDRSKSILDKFCDEDASDEEFPVRRMKRFAGQKGVELPKKFEGKSGRKREKTSRKYILSEDVQRLKGNRKDCKVNVQARCEGKLRTDKLKSFSLFPLQKKIVTYIQTTESRKKTFAEISQCMFSEIMSAFTEVKKKL